MANFMYNIGRGRAHEFSRRVLDNDPAGGELTVVVVNTTETDATLQDLNDLAAILANANTAEVTNTNYARVDITDVSGGLTVTVDDTNNRVDIDISDITWSSVAAGDNWTDLMICYGEGGADSTLVPISQHDFVVTPDGSDITAQIDAAGFYRAS